MDNTDVNTIELGTGGTPLVILHGWGQSAQAMQPLAELLASKRRVIAVDLPGFGQSPPPPEPWGSSEYAECIVKLVKEKKVENCDLLGHSFGGQISIHITTRYPELVERLILIGSAGIKRRRNLKARLRIVYVRTLAKLVKLIDRVFGLTLFKDRFTERFGSRDYKNAGELRPILVKAVNEDLSEVTATIDKKTLLLWGEKDLETPREMAERFQELISNSELVVLPGQDHFPFLGSGAHLCAYQIERFLSGGNSNKG